MLHKLLDVVFSVGAGCVEVAVFGLLVLWWTKIQDMIYGYTPKNERAMGMVMLLLWGLNVGMFLYVIGHGVIKAFVR